MSILTSMTMFYFCSNERDRCSKQFVLTLSSLLLFYEIFCYRSFDITSSRWSSQLETQEFSFPFNCVTQYLVFVMTTPSLVSLSPLPVRCFRNWRNSNKKVLQKVNCNICCRHLMMMMSVTHLSNSSHPTKKGRLTSKNEGSRCVNIRFSLSVFFSSTFWSLISSERSHEVIEEMRGHFLSSVLLNSS
jgi:hypothetical protein